MADPPELKVPLGLSCPTLTGDYTERSPALSSTGVALPSPSTGYACVPRPTGSPVLRFVSLALPFLFFGARTEDSSEALQQIRMLVVQSSGIWQMCPLHAFAE